MKQIRGKVIRGERIATHSGYPTANLRWIVLRNKKIAKGVYIAQAEMSGRLHQALLVIGVPGVRKFKKGKVEVYLLDYNKSIYGQWLKISILKRLRPIISYNSTALLNKQIRKDIQQAKKYFI